MDDLCQTDDSVFIGTGVCDGWIPGVEINGDSAETTTFLIDVKSSNIIKTKSKYSISKINQYINGGI